MKIPADVKKLIYMLEERGHEAYAVGGCVRDLMRGASPHDWDICTSALPRQTAACFSDFRTIETGIKHGTITVLVGQRPYEVTTFRADGAYSDNRHPDQVRFVADLKEDLARRDFTVNAMAYHPISGLADYFGGEGDLRRGLIRCVGDADERFGEDALRILRALRFSAQLCFSIDEATSRAIHKNKGLLRNISAERICGELKRMLMGECAERIMREHADVFCVFIPEIKPMIGFAQNTPYHSLDVWQHTVTAVSYAPFDLTVRLALLFHDIAKPHTHSADDKGIAHFYGHARESAIMAEEIMRRIRFDNVAIEDVKELIWHHSADLIPQEKQVKRWLNRIGEAQFRRLVAMKRADAMAHHPDCAGERVGEIDKIPACIDHIIEQKQCFTLRDLAVNGHDLMNAGIPKGAEVGIALDGLLQMVIDGRIVNEREELLEASRSILKRWVPFP